MVTVMEQVVQLVKVPLSDAVWSTRRRYCGAVGLSMGEGIAGLIAHELGTLANKGEHHGAVFAAESQRQLAAKSDALDVRERLLAEREQSLKASERLLRARTRPLDTTSRPSAGRNDPCPCGSGYEYTDDAQARYTGNPVANAQALVAKAAAVGEFESAHLDVTRSNMPASVLQWVEQQPDSETLADIDVSYYCNGDSMFHVNKGVIAFKMDAAENVTMKKTSVNGLVNLGVEGSTLCGDYLEGFSHPLANLYGYGGSAVRGYIFAGSTNVLVKESEAHNLSAVQGPAIGFEVMTDAADVRFIKSVVRNVVAGWGDPMDPYGSTESAKAVGFRVSATAGPVTIDRGCATVLSGVGGSWFLHDDSGSVVASMTCEASS